MGAFVVLEGGSLLEVTHGEHAPYIQENTVSGRAPPPVQHFCSSSKPLPKSSRGKTNFPTNLPPYDSLPKKRLLSLISPTRESLYKHVPASIAQSSEKSIPPHALRAFDTAVSVLPWKGSDLKSRTVSLRCNLDQALLPFLSGGVHTAQAASSGLFQMLRLGIGPFVSKKQDDRDDGDSDGMD